MQVPDFFVLGICPFVGAAGFEINARLRYRIGNDGKVSFSYILDRPFKVIENAFKAAREQIEAATGNTVHLGTVTVGQPPAL
jgi:hypothetical protein